MLASADAFMYSIKDQYDQYSISYWRNSLLQVINYTSPINLVGHQQIDILLIGFSLLFDLLPTNENSKS